MTKTVWTLPIPSTALIHGAVFDVLPQRQCRLTMLYEHEDGEKRLELIFRGLETYKCTYFSSCTAEQITAAYGKLIVIDDSAMLVKILELLRSKKIDTADVSHYAIFFDDGPYFEFVCRGYSVVESEVQAT